MASSLLCRAHAFRFRAVRGRLRRAGTSDAEVEVSPIALVSDDGRLARIFQACGLDAARVTEDEARALAAATTATAAPAVLVLDVRPHHRLAPWVSELQKTRPGVAVVVIVSALDTGFILEAMRAGIKECLPEPLAADALNEAVRRLLVSGSRERTGQIVAVVGAKGGVGATTVAVNVATALAGTSDSPPLLIDLHLAQGDAALLMGAAPRWSVLDAFENLHRVDESFLSGLVEQTRWGPHVLASSTPPANVATSPTATRTLLDLAARRYPITVLDVPRSDVTMLEALDPATTIVVVTNQDVSSVRGAATTVAALRQRYGSQRLRVVINRHDPGSAVTAQDVTTIVGEPVACLIPSDIRVAAAAIDAGRPIVTGSTALAEALRAAAAVFVNPASAAGQYPRDATGRGRTWRRA